MKFKALIAGAIAAAALTTAGAANAATATVVIHKPHKTIVMKEKGRFIPRERVVEVIKARNIRVVGEPYMHRGAYVVKCRERNGRIAFCRINPRTGAFLGISVRL